MRKTALKTLVTFFVFIAIHTSSAQTQKFDAIADALRTGNSSALANFFEGNVEITIVSGGASYSKSQAELVLKKFFSGHPAKSFSLAHEGTSPEGSKYFIGDLITTTGSYHTYVYAKMINKKLVVQEIRFEEK